MIDALEGMSCGGVDEEEKAPKGRVIAWICTSAEYSSSSRFGDGPGSLDNERPKWQRFLDEVGEAVDRRVRGEMLR